MICTGRRAPGPALADLRADQQAAQIFGEIGRGDLAEQAGRAHAEEAVEQRAGPARLAPRRARRGQSSPLAVALLHQPPEDRVVARGGEDLAGHVGREGGDPAGLCRHPFGMRARQQEAAAVDPEPRQRAEDLRLLAAHDVVHRRRCWSRGRRRCARPLPRKGTRASAAARSPMPAGGCDVGRLDPALAAADHARHQDGGFSRRPASRRSRLSARCQSSGRQRSGSRAARRGGRGCARRCRAERRESCWSPSRFRSGRERSPPAPLVEA